jgi:hypothetical protein
VVLVSFAVSGCLTPQFVEMSEPKIAVEEFESTAVVELKNLSPDELVGAYFVDLSNKVRTDVAFDGPVRPGSSVRAELPTATGQLVLSFDTAQGAQTMTTEADFTGSDFFLVEISTDFAPVPGSDMAQSDDGFQDAFYGGYGYLSYDYLASYEYLTYDYMGD